MGHSILPPSSAGIWGKPDGCTGWVAMTQQYPDLLDNVEAAEGEAAHEIGACLIDAHAHANTAQLNADRYVGTLHDNGEPYTQEMFDAAEIYADDVATVMRASSVFGGDNLGIEKQLTIPLIHEQSWGTPDCWLFDRKNGELYIWDFKFGHLVVEAYENWQMMNYIAGLITLLQIDGVAEQHITVYIRVIQPRAFHHDGVVREWKTTLVNLRGYFNILRANAEKTLSDDAECRTGSHCKYCSARHVCTPALQMGMSMYEFVGKPTPVELSPQALGVQLMMINRAAEAVKLLQTGFNQQVESVIRSGKLVPGFRTVTGKGREKWDKPPSEIIMLGEMLGHDLRKTDALITPKQAVKLGIDEAVISSYSVTPSTGIKVVPDNDNKAKQVFES